MALSGVAGAARLLRAAGQLLICQHAGLSPAGSNRRYGETAGVVLVTVGDDFSTEEVQGWQSACEWLSVMDASGLSAEPQRAVSRAG